MTRIEEAVKAALERPSVAPLLPNPDELVSRARRHVRRARAMSVGTAAIAAMTIALASAAIATRSDQRVSTPTQPRPAPSVFVATQTPESDSSVTRLQERAISDGHIVREITSITSVYQALARAPDGSVIAALSDKGGCAATLERIDRVSGQRHVIRQVGQSVSELSVSPDGRRVAFVTSTECIASHTAPAAFVQSSAPNKAAPSGFVILDLTTGRLVSTQTDAPGHPLGLATWSSDGRQVATDYFDGHER